MITKVNHANVLQKSASLFMYVFLWVYDCIQYICTVIENVNAVRWDILCRWLWRLDIGFILPTFLKLCVQYVKMVSNGRAVVIAYEPEHCLRMHIIFKE